jgi:hypothetical protein
VTKTTLVKKPSHKLAPRIGLNLLVVILLATIGIISFVYADGLSIIYRSWMSLVIPRIQFNITPENSIIPANGLAQIYIDIQLKNNQDQLLDGTEITAAIISGQTELTVATITPTNISKRVLLRAPNQPQLITLAFSYKHLTKNIAIEAFDPTPPSLPTLTAPTNNAIFNTATPLISGQAPVSTQVEIYIDTGLNSTLEVDKTGNFSHPLEQAIRRGRHTLTAATINKYGIRSAISSAINIDIQTPDPEIDLSNLRITPNPVKAGETFRIFIPVSADTKAVSLELDKVQYPLQDANKSSVFSGVIPAPKNPGLYRLSLLVTTEAGESILEEKVASIQVN